MKTAVLRLLIVAVCTVLLFSSCVKPNPPMENEVESLSLAPDEVIRDATVMAMTEKYLYYVAQFQADAYEGQKVTQVRRVNITTGETSSACVDSLCTHDTIECPCFGARTMAPVRIFGDWLCIQTNFTGSLRKIVFNANNSGITRRRILYNTQTGEWFPILEDQVGADKGSFELFYDGKYVYAVAYGSSSKDAETGEIYTPSIIRSINLKTKEEKDIFSHKFQISLAAVSQGRVYFYETIGDEFYRFYSVTTEGEDFREESNMKIEPRHVYRNRIYGTSADNRLLINDVNTGEVSTVDCFITQNAIDIANEYLYYMERENLEELYHQMSAYTQEDLKDPIKREESILLEKKMNSCIAYLWRCNLDGSDPQKILELGTAYERSIRIVGEYCYLYDYYYDPETDQFYWGDKQYYESATATPKICRIHLETGVKETLGE